MQTTADAAEDKQIRHLCDTVGMEQNKKNKWNKTFWYLHFIFQAIWVFHVYPTDESRVQSNSIGHVLYLILFDNKSYLYWIVSAPYITIGNYLVFIQVIFHLLISSLVGGHFVCRLFSHCGWEFSAVRRRMIVTSLEFWRFVVTVTDDRWRYNRPIGRCDAFDWLVRHVWDDRTHPKNHTVTVLCMLYIHISLYIYMYIWFIWG